MADGPGEPVGAQHQDVAVGELEPAKIDVDVLGRADRLQDHVAVLELLGLLCGELPALHQEDGEALIARELHEPAVA